MVTSRIVREPQTMERQAWRQAVRRRPHSRSSLVRASFASGDSRSKPERTRASAQPRPLRRRSVTIGQAKTAKAVGFAHAHGLGQEIAWLLPSIGGLCDEVDA